MSSCSKARFEKLLMCVNDTLFVYRLLRRITSNGSSATSPSGASSSCSADASTSACLQLQTPPSTSPASSVSISFSAPSASCEPKSEIPVTPRSGKAHLMRNTLVVLRCVLLHVLGSGLRIEMAWLAGASIVRCAKKANPCSCSEARSERISMYVHVTLFVHTA